MMDKQTDVQRMAIALANAEPVKAKIPAYSFCVVWFAAIGFRASGFTAWHS